MYVKLYFDMKINLMYSVKGYFGAVGCLLAFNEYAEKS
jgi:hypothetical protein